MGRSVFRHAHPSVPEQARGRRRCWGVSVCCVYLRLKGLLGQHDTLRLPNHPAWLGRAVESRLSIEEPGMADLVSELTARAKALPPEDRTLLAEELLATLGTNDDEVHVAWGDEIRRRIAEVENGTVRLVPANEAFAQVRQALRR